jgi:ABC-type dipeptide/oligopeptide/nickel transport system permease subunit
VITYLARRIGAAVVVVLGISVVRRDSLGDNVAITVALSSRCQRSSAMDVLAQDHIELARAKGLPEWMVLGRHLVRSACLPMVTLIGLRADRRRPADPAGLTMAKAPARSPGGTRG